MRAYRPLLLLGVVLGCTGRVGDVTPEAAQNPNQPRPVDPNQPIEPPVDVCLNAPKDPGRVTIHRLNRAEYDNTVRDLIGTAQRPALDFPNDDHGYGFDNIADVLAMAPLLAEKYQLAAEALVEEVFAKPFSGPVTQQVEAETMAGEVGGVAGSYWNLYSNGELNHRFTTEIEGRYEVSTRLFGQQAGPDPARAELTLDGRSLGIFDVPETEAAPRTITVSAELAPGSHTFTVAFTNDFYEAPNDRNLMVDWLRAVGPLDYSAPPTNQGAYARVMICSPQGNDREPCARQILTTFAKRAWRRPITPAEADRLYALANVAYTEGEDFDTGIKLAVQGILLSPHFLYRVELDPNPSSLVPHNLTAHELATRLSYFLWSSTPDEQLMAKADDGTLMDLAVLRAEAARMLADPKAVALVDNFAGQWLYTRRVDDVLPDPAVYPNFDDELRAAMAAETRAFFGSFLEEQKNILEMLDANYTYVNDRLAAHYGLPLPGSDELVRVQLPAGQRGGLLSQASILTVTSRPKRTAPVIRGKWILEQLLCQAPPPPPPGVEGFPENASTGTIRERLAIHRENPTCASCHDVMDPLGLALENFDGVGTFRTMDGTSPVDATGALPDGRSFDGAKELAQMLRADPKTPRCMTERTFIYAMGRGPETFDRCSLNEMTRTFNEGGNTFEALVTALVTHPTFTTRRGEAP